MPGPSRPLRLGPLWKVLRLVSWLPPTLPLRLTEGYRVVVSLRCLPVSPIHWRSLQGSSQQVSPEVLGHGRDITGGTPGFPIDTSSFRVSGEGRKGVTLLKSNRFLINTTFKLVKSIISFIFYLTFTVYDVILPTSSLRPRLADRKRNPSKCLGS